MTATTRRTVRIPEDLWQAAKAVAAARGETLSDIIRDRLAGYLKEEQA